MKQTPEITDDELTSIRFSLSQCSPLIQALVARIDRVEGERHNFAMLLQDVACDFEHFGNGGVSGDTEKEVLATVQDIRRTCGNSD